MLSFLCNSLWLKEIQIHSLSLSEKCFSSRLMVRILQLFWSKWTTVWPRTPGYCSQNGRCKRLHDCQPVKLCIDFTKRSSWVMFVTPRTIYACHTRDSLKYINNSGGRTEFLMS